MCSKTIVLAGVLAIAVGCSSAPKSVVDTDHIGQETVLQEHGDSSLKNAEPFKIDGGYAVATSQSTLAADGTRLEAATKLAQMRSRAELAHTISVKLESYNQVASEDGSIGSQTMHEIIGTTSKLTAQEFVPGKIYYEKVKVISDSGVPRTEYRVWAEMKLNEAAYKRQVLSAIRDQDGKGPGFSQQFAKQVSDHFDRMLSPETPVKQTAEAIGTDSRKPASIATQSEAGQ